MDTMQKFWMSFYVYLGITVIIMIVGILLKIPPQKSVKIHRIPSIAWAFVVFIWVIGLPFWIGVIVGGICSAIFWYLSPGYIEVIRSAGEATGKAIKKNNDKNNKK